GPADLERAGRLDAPARDEGMGERGTGDPISVHRGPGLPTPRDDHCREDDGGDSHEDSIAGEAHDLLFSPHARLPLIPRKRARTFQPNLVSRLAACSRRLPAETWPGASSP